MPTPLYCPRCGSDQLVRLAKNDISPFCGYRCPGCGRRLRDRGSLPAYLGVLAVGLFFAWAALVTLDRPVGGADRLKAAGLGAVAAVVVGYAAVELARPVPRTRPRNAGAADDGWFVARNGVRTGPWAFAELRRQGRAGELTPDDMVRPPGADAWLSAGGVAGLFDADAQS